MKLTMSIVLLELRTILKKYKLSQEETGTSILQYIKAYVNNKLSKCIIKAKLHEYKHDKYKTYESLESLFTLDKFKK